MNRTKLTPCRKVGLSRKKNTPSRTVDSLLAENSINQTTVTPISTKQEKTTITAKKIELNSDTPCRHVGLSRKRKTPTLLGSIKTIRNISNTPSLRSPLANVIVKQKKLVDVSNKKEQNQSNCAVRLSERFSSSFSPHIPELNNLENSVYANKCNMSNAEELQTSIGEISFSQSVIEVDEKKEVTIGEVHDQNEIISQKINNDEDIDKKGESQFIKVCYKVQEAETVRSEQNTKTKTLSLPKKPKFNRKIFEDDDDFEVSQKKVKSKNRFGRYETDVGSLQKRVPNKEVVPLKKSLSIGDKKLSNGFTLSQTTSEKSVTDCFVKLVQMENMTKKSSPRVPILQELSDDDFDMFTPTPPRNKIKELEKKVKEKRNILEELKRAKVCRKLHDINELKSLTLRWQNGCKLALTNLLEQLNTHTEMNMEMLLKKLNIPPDFVLSQ